MPGSRRPHCYRAPAPVEAPPNVDRQTPNAGALGAAVQTLAQYRGLSLMALARASAPGHDPQEIYRIARGQCREIKVTWLLRVCRALSCDPDALLRLAGLWPHQGAGDRAKPWAEASKASGVPRPKAGGQGAGDDGDGWNEEALLDLRLSEAEDQVALWPDGERSAVLRVLEAMAPLAVAEEPAHVCSERARGA